MAAGTSERHPVLHGLADGPDAGERRAQVVRHPGDQLAPVGLGPRLLLARHPVAVAARSAAMIRRATRPPSTAATGTAASSTSSTVVESSGRRNIARELA